MRKIELKIDVSDAVKLPIPQKVAGTVYLPDRQLTDPPIVIFAAPGGGYSRRYFDMHFAGRSGYSEADDISVFIVPRMAHMHNFADTRLWQRVADWAEIQAGRIAA